MRWSSRSYNGESSCCPPGPLPRTTPESHVLPACCREEHLCLLSVRPTFRLAYSLGVRPAFQQTIWFLRAAQFLMFPFVLGKFIYRPTFDCLCERYLTMIQCMLYLLGIFDWWAKYCVDGLFTSSELLSKLTVHKLNFVHESSRFSSCSTEQLWIVSPQPRTPTRRRQSIDVYDCGNRRHRRVLDEGSSRFVRIASVNVFYAGCLYVHLTLTLTLSIHYFLSSNW